MSQRWINPQPVLSALGFFREPGWVRVSQQNRIYRLQSSAVVNKALLVHSLKIVLFWTRPISSLYFYISEKVKIILTAKKQFIYQSCYTYQLTRQVCACLRVFCGRPSPLHKWAHQLCHTAHFSYIHTWIYLSSYSFCWDENSSVDPLERKRETNKDKRTTSLSHCVHLIMRI